MVTHRDRAYSCTGAAIAPRLIATAKHCVFRASAEGDEPLPANGFRVSFGPDEERPLLRFVESLRWIGMPDERDVNAAVEAGEDVAVLRLSEPAPQDSALVAVRSNYLPTDTDEVLLVGFGIFDLATSAAGVRRQGAARVSAFDPDTGQLQLQGTAACFGDSGGPVLFGDDLVAVIGRVAGMEDGGFCEPGITLASSIANPRVRSLLLSECADAGGCGPLDADAPSAGPAGPTADDDGGVDSSDASRPQVAPAVRNARVVDAGGTRVPVRLDRSPDREGCATMGGPGSAPGAPWACVCWMLWRLLARERESRRERPPRSR
jgi:hypothetical protein